MKPLSCLRPAILAACLLSPFCALVLPAPLASEAAGRNPRPNILFIAVDDLRPELGCYGKSHIHSPRIDSLAAGGLVFERSYCNIPVCGASRASLMTGLRPAHNRFTSYLTRADEDAPDVPALNTHFQRQGYHTVSLGKIYHHRTDTLAGWSEPPWRPQGGMTYNLPENQKLHREGAKKDTRPNRGPPYEAADVPDNAYPDGKIADRAVADLRRLAPQSEPFFLAVGFLKPHLPFNCPQRYWDLYDRDDIHPPANYYRPRNAPDVGLHTSGELRAYHGIPNRGILDTETARTLIHGYYACVSFTDAQIGKLLDELDRLQLAQNTIVILWGDHGWNLGEHTLWCKHCCFETSMAAPILVRAPGFPGGQRSRALVEFVDIYPSLCELAGLPQPAHLEGRSFVPLLRQPTQPWNTAVVGRYGRGDTIRTDRYRFTQYWKPGGDLLGRMLYDHAEDPNENVNLSELPALGATVGRLLDDLKAGMGKPRE